MDKDQLPFDVFISHSSKDSLTASAIKQNLQNKGLRCWKAPDDILPGESWPSAIMRALSRCRAMVLVWTCNSMTSTEVSKELTLAMRNNLTVVPFRIDKIEPVGDWEYHLANTHWMDATHGLAAEHYEKLGDFLLKVLAAREHHTTSVENHMSLENLELLIEHSLEDGLLAEQERALLLGDAVKMGRDRDELNTQLDARLALRKREMLVRVPSVSPTADLSAAPPKLTISAPPKLPIPVAASSFHSVRMEPAPASISTIQPPVILSSNRSKYKLFWLGLLWSCAFCIGGSFLTILHTAIFVEKSVEETPFAVTVILILLMIGTLFSPILAVWMTIKGKLPGTKKN